MLFRRVVELRGLKGLLVRQVRKAPLELEEQMAT
jgi:hypothetical protein